jgi:hypothetical protein
MPVFSEIQIWANSWASKDLGRSRKVLKSSSRADQDTKRLRFNHLQSKPSVAFGLVFVRLCE